jgi:hypothetical protein
MTIPTGQTKMKNSTEHIDTISITDVHPDKVQHEEIDKFGSSLVKSPAEVALVKKLDCWMMVSTSIGSRTSQTNASSLSCGSCTS